MAIFNSDGFNQTNKLMEAFNVKGSSPSENIMYQKKGFDGITYLIVKESNSKFCIKTTSGSEIVSENLEFWGGEANKAKSTFSSYNDALKKLNTLFGEQRKATKSKEKFNFFENLNEKYVIKTDVETPVEDESEETTDTGTDDSADDISGDLESGDVEDFSGAEDEADPKTRIQKLSGKLGYEIGQFQGEGENEYSDLAKYVINSVISRLQIDQITDEDKNDILNTITQKFEGTADEGDVDMGDEGDVDMGDEGDVDMGDEGDVQEEIIAEIKISTIKALLEGEGEDLNIVKNGEVYTKKPTKINKDLGTDVNAPKKKQTVEFSDEDPNIVKNEEGAPYTENPTTANDSLINNTHKPKNTVKQPFDANKKDPNIAKGKNAPYSEQNLNGKLLESYSIDEIMQEFYEEDDLSAEFDESPATEFNDKPIYTNNLPKGAKVDLDQYIVPYYAEMEGEEPFKISDRDFTYVKGLYPVKLNGEMIGWKSDIAVYAQQGDLVYGYKEFRKTHNLQGEGNVREGEDCGCSDGDMLLTDKRKKKYNIPMSFYDDLDSTDDLGGEMGGMGEDMGTPLEDDYDIEIPDTATFDPDDDTIEDRGERRIPQGGGLTGISGLYNPFNFVKK